MKENERFRYTYSAKEQKEIEAIRKKYTFSEEEDKMETLRRLDASVTKKASAVAILVGVVGALILGTGMSFIMTDIGALFLPSEIVCLFVGIFVGILGMGLICLAYPAYLRLLKKQRERVAPQILRLTEELMK